LSEYLIVAEVDKIQSFIFRSSRLREIAGGSRLLEDLCEEIKQKYGRQALSSAGGSFRIVVDESEIDMVISDLRQKFEQNIGGSITITSLPYSSDSDVIKRGNAELRRAKLQGSDPEPVWYSPYHAICASSGEELAVAYERPGGFLPNGQPRFPDERSHYLGETTRKKGDEKAANELLDKFIGRMQKTTVYKKVEKLPKPTEADTYAQFDPRQYVAYMVSDGNGMGVVFNACSSEELPNLSSNIGDITTDALIHAVEGMCAETHRNGQMQFPVLPLISGGDDLFVLMPAPWAVDVVRRYCEFYQNGYNDQYHTILGMTEFVKKEVEKLRKEAGFLATTGAAVVICKASYPYRSAYQYAHDLLSEAKKQAKAVKQSCLIVDFVVGSDTVVADSRVEPKPHTFEDAEYFTRQRVDLKGIASRTRHQVSEALSSEKDADQKITQIIKQVKRQYPDFEYADNLQRAYDEDPIRLSELLKLWDFCYDMRESSDSYRTEER
jgi:hypothetical protein